MILQPALVREALCQVCAANKTPDGPERADLIDDVVILAETFSEMMAARGMRLRLDAVSTNACRKFHLDAITARLICTYRGAGTQYGTSRDGADPVDVFTAPTGAPMVLRGTLWPEAPRSGLVHRSPLIEGTHSTRLVLVLDPIDDPEGAF